MTPYERPSFYLREIRSRYDEPWIQVEDFRRARGKGLPAWPEWCYLPLAASYAIVSGGGSNRVPLERMPEVGVLGALATWRVTQGIYEYDQTILDALAATPIEGDIPTEVLYRLPEWCPYILTPGVTLPGLGDALHGFFAHLEWDAKTTRHELRLVLDVDRDGRPQLLVWLPLHLGHGSLTDCLAAAAEEGRRQAAAIGVEIESTLAVIGGLSIAPLVSILLYLCSEASEIHERAVEGTGREHPRRPPARYPKAPTTWAVGYRLGAAITRGACARGARGHGRIARAPAGPYPQGALGDVLDWCGPHKGGTSLAGPDSDQRGPRPDHSDHPEGGLKNMKRTASKRDPRPSHSHEGHPRRADRCDGCRLRRCANRTASRCRSVSRGQAVRRPRDDDRDQRSRMASRT